MAIVVPVEDPSGKRKIKGWFRVTKTRAGEVLLKALNPQPLYVRKATELIMKLADNQPLTASERRALLLLAALWMVGSLKIQHQSMGFKLMKEILGDDPVEITPELQEAALRDLGLA